MREIAVAQKPLRISGGRTDCIVVLIALRVDELRAHLQSVLAESFSDVIAEFVGWVSVSPRHVRRIRCKTLTTVCGVSAEERNSRHLPTEAVIKNMTNGALGDARDGVDAESRIA